MILRAADILTDSLRFVAQQRRALFDIALVPIVLALLLDLLITPLLIGGDPMLNAQTNPFGTLLAIVLAFLLSILPIVLFAVKWTRYCLLTPGQHVRGIERWSTRETRYLLGLVKLFVFYSLGLGAAMMLLSAFQGRPMPNARAVALMGLLLLLIGGSFFARVSLILPASAFDLRFDFRTALRYGQGNGWRLFGALALLMLLAVTLLMVLSYVATLFMRLFFAEPFSLGPSVVLALIFETLSFLLSAPLLTAMAFSFRALTGWKENGSVLPPP